MNASVDIVKHIDMDHHCCDVCSRIKHTLETSTIQDSLNTIGRLGGAQGDATCLATQWICLSQGQILSVEHMKRVLGQKGRYNQLTQQVPEFRHILHRVFTSYHMRHQLWDPMGYYFYSYHLIVAQFSHEYHFPLDITVKVLSFTRILKKMNQMVQKSPNPQKRKRPD